MTNEPFTEETTGQIDPQNPFDNALENAAYRTCLLYTTPSPRDGLLSRMPSSA